MLRGAMNKRRVWILGGVLGLLCACGGSAATETKAPTEEQAPLPPFDVTSTRAFTGPEGLRIEVVELRSGEALVYATGVRSELADKAFLANPEREEPYFRYQLKWHGRTINMLVRRDSSDGTGSWHAYMPDATRDGFALQYSEELSGKVDAKSIYDLHARQARSGELAAVQAFDRAAEEANVREEIESNAKHVAQSCGVSIPMMVNFKTVSDEEILSKSISGYCDSIYTGLRNICDNEAGKRFVAANVKSVTCSFDGKGDLDRDGTQLKWAIGFDVVNLDQKATAELKTLKVENGTLHDQLLAADTNVCTDPSGKYVLMFGPADAPHHGMAYGQGKELFYVHAPEALGGTWFFDPRQKNEQNNPSFRGYDLRYFSQVEADRGKGTCKVICGTREIPMRLLDEKAKAEAMRDVEFAPGPLDREPYALARDRQGTYYYVDRGITPELAKDFHLYKGKRGKMKPLAMRDVVSDSEGEIFASESGKLRLIVGKEEAQWVTGEQPRKLTRLPLGENYGLIYNELGMYLGNRFGVPCDDL